MSIFSFKKCELESEIRKVKIIYSIIFIILFVVSIGTVLLINETIISPIYEKGLGEGDFEIIEKETENLKKISEVTGSMSFLFQIFLLYLTIWACLKLGMGKIPSILWGIVALVPFVSLIPFIIILTRKFSPKQFEDKVKLP
jgi:hypothetical protein